MAVAEKKTSDEIIPFIGDLSIDYDVNSDGVTCTVTGIGTFEGTELIIPDYIRRYKVTAIGYNAFENCTALTKLVIPETTKSIGTRAFYRCSSLTSISIPYSVTSIGMYAFACCSSLTDVYYTGLKAETIPCIEGSRVPNRFEFRLFARIASLPLG